MNMDKFACHLEEFLEQELDEVGDSGGRSTEHGRFCAHRMCFESLIDKHSTYKDLLFRIKSEYETCIAAIERGQREAPYLSAKLASAVLQPETLRNYRKRRNELELRVALLRTCNARLQSKIKPSRISRGEEKSYLRFIHSKSRTPASVLLSDGLCCRSRPRVVPSLSMQQLTDIVFLRKKLAQLEACVAQTKLEHETRFLPKQMKGQLFTRLQGKEVIKEELLNKRESLKMRIMSLKLSLAVEENKFNISSRRRKGRAGFSNLARALKETQDTMIRADELCEEESEDKREKPNPLNEVYAQPSLPNIHDEDDPRSDREAEFILEYIEKFAELFAKGHVQDAAQAAAYSPKGSLRTPETLQKFKEYDISQPCSSLCLVYWEALLPTVSTGCPKPSDWETKECVACALDKGRSDLLTHWIAQDQLTLSENVGQLIRDACHCDESCICGLTGLAEAVFQKVGAYKEVIYCLVRQGKFHSAVSYLDNNSDLSKTDFLEAFRNCPSSDRMLSFLTTECNESFHLFSMEQVISLLLQKTDDLNLIKEYINNAILSGSEINVTEIMRPGVEEFTMETYDKWDRLSDKLRVHGLHELAEELLSLAVVSYACYSARMNSRRHPPSTSPREF